MAKRWAKPKPNKADVDRRVTPKDKNRIIVWKSLIRDPMIPISQRCKQLWLSYAQVFFYIKEAEQVANQWTQKIPMIKSMLLNDIEIQTLAQEEMLRRLWNKADLAMISSKDLMHILALATKRYMLFAWKSTDPFGWLDGESWETEDDIILDKLIWENIALLPKPKDIIDWEVIIWDSEDE